MISTTAPAGFVSMAATAEEAFFLGNVHRGPIDGIVETTWTPEEGVMVYVGNSEGLSVADAHQLVADLQSALGRVAGL